VTDNQEQRKKDAEAAGLLAREGIVGFIFGEEPGQIKLKSLRTRLRQSLNAKEVKAFKMTEVAYNEGGREITAEYVIYSDPLIAHSIRLQAQKLCFDLLDAFPSQKHEHDHRVTGTIDLETRLNKAKEMRSEHDESGAKD